MEDSPNIGVVFATLGDREFDQHDYMKMLRNAGATYIVSVIPMNPDYNLDLIMSASDEVLFDHGEGQPAALILGFEALYKKGVEFWNWSCDDDRIYPGAYLKLANEMMSNENCTLAFGNCVYVDESGSKIAVSNFGRLAISLLPLGPDLVPSPSSLLSVSETEACGGILRESGLAVDYDLFLRLKKVGEFAYLNSDLAEFGWTRTSRTRSQRMRSSLDASRARIRNRSKFSPLIFLEPGSILLNFLAGKIITAKSKLKKLVRNSGL